MEDITIVKDTENKTPIEIVLKIDENGMTSAIALYEWLELDPSHYARWCKHHILNNPFAIEGEDYTEIKPDNLIKYEGKNSEFPGNPNPKIDYHITANFAKKLAMLTKSDRGEIARIYFLKVENEFKVTIKQYYELLNHYHELEKQISTLE